MANSNTEVPVVAEEHEQVESQPQHDNPNDEKPPTPPIGSFNKAPFGRDYPTKKAKKTAESEDTSALSKVSSAQLDDSNVFCGGRGEESRKRPERANAALKDFDEKFNKDDGGQPESSGVFRGRRGE